MTDAPAPAPAEPTKGSCRRSWGAVGVATVLALLAAALLSYLLAPHDDEPQAAAAGPARTAPTG